MANWFSSANAFFLCVCPNGHTVVENFQSSECHQIELETNNNVDTQISPQDGCPGCQDVSLSSDSINSNFNHFKNTHVQQIHAVNDFIKTNIASLIQDQPYLPASFIQTDHRLRLFTDSVRLII